MKIVAATVVGVLSLGAAAHGSITPIANNDVSDFSDLGVSAPLNLTGVVSGIGGTGLNRFTSSFDSADLGGNGRVSGTITSEVFGNTTTPGGGLTDLVIKYTFTNSGFSPIDEMDFGVNSSASLDANDLTRFGTTQGRINGESTAGLATPSVFVNDAPTSVLWTFDFEAGGGQLAASQTLTWYVKTDGNVSIQLVDVTVKDGEDAEAQALAFVDLPNQPDLGVPAPGAVALMGLAGLMAARRRRD